MAEPKVSYKSQWSRFVAQKKLEKNFEVLSRKLASSHPELGSAPSLPKLIDTVTQGPSPTIKHVGFTPKDPNAITIGIVGAGAAGLFTAMLVDTLVANVPGLKITYDIYEAADPQTRGGANASKEAAYGGRLFTYRFPGSTPGDHAYYDVGAMRFPQNDVMDRTFRLFKYLKITPVPYAIVEPNKLAPTQFNNTLIYGPPSANDPYGVNADLQRQDEELVDPSIWGVDPDDILLKLVKSILDDVTADNDFEKLMAADALSTRQFLASTTNNPKPIPNGPGYNYNSIEWLETVTYGTGWYDQALTEIALETLDFQVEDPVKNWFRVDQGAQTIATTMAATLKNFSAAGGIKVNSTVTALISNTTASSTSQPYGIAWTDSTGKAQNNSYDAVFNSTTLAAMGMMSLKDSGLLYGARQAIRSLGYGASCKVAVQFSKAWWKDYPANAGKNNGIQGGQGKTDLPIRCVVYPSFAVDDQSPAVLIVSYTWGQDAQRIAALISPEDPTAGTALKALIIDNLARLHTVPGTADYTNLLATLNSTYERHHAWEWYHDPKMAGAFGYFGPSQYSQMWPELIKPQAYNQLYLIGEATSAHHAWVVGALESAERAIYLMLTALAKANPSFQPYQDAITYLNNQQTQMPADSPFWPVPFEVSGKTAAGGGTSSRMPAAGKNQNSLPGAAKRPAMSFAEAQVSLAHLESLVSEIGAESK